MTKTYKVLVIDNGAGWEYRDIYQNIKEFFGPTPFAFRIRSITRAIKGVEFERYTEKGTTRARISRLWLYRHIAPLGKSYDLTVFCVDRDWFQKMGGTPSLRGTFYSPSIAVVTGRDKDTVRISRRRYHQPTYTFIHEIGHFLSRALKVRDTLHDHVDAGCFVEFFTEYLPVAAKLMTTEPRQRLYEAARRLIGKDISPSQDELGCAESVNNILIDFGGILGRGLDTGSMYRALKTDLRFKEVKEHMAGDIIISPTGYGNGRLANGHVGIMAPNGIVMSNDSRTSLWMENFTVSSWKAYYEKKGGFPTKFFRLVSVNK